MRKIAPADIKTVPEPISKWRNLHGENILDLLYQDPNRWSFAFNFHMMLSRLKLHSQVPPGRCSITMMERSFYSTFHVFIRNSRNAGNLSDTEYLTLKGHFETFSETNSPVYGLTSLWPTVDLFVYMRVSPEIALKRLKKRRRSEEKGIDVGFLRQLHDLHEDYFLPDVNGYNRDGIPVLVIDNNESLMKNTCQDLVRQIFRYPQTDS